MLNKTSLANSYIDWLKEQITLKDLDNGVIEITTPFMDKNNDFLQVFVIPEGNGKIKITDDAYIVSELSLSGCEINSTKKRKEIFQVMINGFGVKYSPKTDELYVEATIDNFAQKKHMLIQAMLSVNDMFMMSKQNVMSIFLEDVEKYLDDYNIRYINDVSFAGKSGFVHKFNFAIPKSKQAPERIIHTINNPNKDVAKTIIFNWGDTKENRKPDSKLYTFLNDTNLSVDNEIITALKNYDIEPVLWKERQKYIEELSA